MFTSPEKGTELDCLLQQVGVVKPSGAFPLFDDGLLEVELGLGHGDDDLLHAEEGAKILLVKLPLHP